MALRVGAERPVCFWLFALVVSSFSPLSAASAVTEKYSAAERRHWAFQPRSNPPVPKIAGASNPIDAFLLARLQKEGLRFAPPASRLTLVRRVYFDLTGLPPSPAEIDAFLQDRSPKAWEKLIDRLLASPHYAERWAQHWLDVVRFAESDGFEYDAHRPNAWRYRDYVIDSFRTDKPYDQFLTEQLAGDEIDPDNPVLRTAAGFQRLGPLRKNAGNQEVASSRNEVLTEMTNLIGSGLLGVTLGCARCHDHKFDPIRQTDYYRIQAYFAAVHDKDLSLATPEQEKAYQEAKAAHEAELKRLRQTMEKLTGEEKGRMLQKIRNLEETPPEPPPAVFSVLNDMSKMSPIHVLARGDYQNKGPRVFPRPLGVLIPDNTPELPATTPNPRTQLAKWITDPSHPLTARVMVNRIWHYHFGQGIVRTPNDFGRMGTRPSHPELLDYLANEFVNQGWRMKPLHKMILMSQAYQQSSDSPLEALGHEKDPEVTLLWKFPRRRLDAEQIRDAMLSIAGRLNPKMGGPSVIVPVDQELVNLLYKPSQWAVTKDPSEHDRRSIYLLHKRNLRLPLMEVFDAPDLQLSCARRESSTHAPQALELLNGPFANEMARSLAARLDREAGASREKQVDLAFRLATGRLPNPKEKAAALAFLKTQPLREFALAILNLNAFLYVN
ncbi:MAG: DUF1549 and DUF1553 domain-containing protein [Bryobacteraceae bacterium]|nr:DUF1549 and DUF1553 domain-containing protein [Bryobacteraceae bacterium]MDW8378393.1 DUF1549 and DUF1553 domain-containing protein [Bryobacterales bacterium]